MMNALAYSLADADGSRPASRSVQRSGTAARKVLIFRQKLLPVSETFISAQVGAMRTFAAQYAGLSTATPSLPFSQDPVLLRNTDSRWSRMRARLYNSFAYAPQFHARAAGEGASLIHAHFGPDGAAALPLAAALRVPLVVTLHGYDVTMRDTYHARTTAGRQYLAARPKLWEKASLFLCVSEYIRQTAIAAGFPKNKLRVHYIGINRREFIPPQDSSPRGPVVLFVGRLKPSKGLDHLLRAMSMVRRIQPAAELVVIGDGPLRKESEALARRLSVPCRFLGSQPATVVRDWIARSALLSSPSVYAKSGESEGFGMVALEAQAMGTPVVGFRTGGIPEAVAHRLTGMLADSGNEEELAQYIVWYLSDRELWKQTSRSCPDWVAEHFDLHERTRELEGIYEELIG